MMSMIIQEHNLNNQRIAEVITTNKVFDSIENGVELFGNIYAGGYDSVIIYKESIENNFFKLSTGIAGEILQKFVNYRIRLVIVGDFSTIESKSLRDFVMESNKKKQINFLPNIETAIALLSTI